MTFFRSHDQNRTTSDSNFQPQFYHSTGFDSICIRCIYFGTKTSECCLRIISFSSLGSELSFDSKDSKINFDRARSTTVKSLLGALRAPHNISSDDGEDLFADELLVY